MSESLLGNTVYLTNDEYLTLIANGSVTLASGNAVTYSENDLYIVPEILDITPTEGSTNAVTSGGVYTSISYLTTKLNSYALKTDLSSYVTSSDLTTKLNSYALKTDVPDLSNNFVLDNYSLTIKW